MGRGIPPDTASLTFSSPYYEKTKPIHVQIIGDTIPEFTEQFHVVLIPDNVAPPELPEGPASPWLGVGTITDDPPPLPKISILDPEEIAEGNDGSVTLHFPVHLDGITDPEESVTVQWKTADGLVPEGKDLANAGTDYVPTPKWMTKELKAAEDTIEVTILGDREVERDQVFYVKLANPANAVIADDAAMGTIKDDDSAPLPKIAILDPDGITEGDDGSVTLEFPVHLDRIPDPNTPVTVQWQTANGPVPKGKELATAGTDYVPTPGWITKTLDAKEDTIEVKILGDREEERDQVFYVKLANPDNAVIIDGEAKGIITDDDTVPPRGPVYIEDAEIFEGDEGEEYARFRVYLDPSYSRSVRVLYWTFGGTAREGEDFEYAEDEFTLDAEHPEHFVKVTVFGDRIIEPNEEFQVRLASLDVDLNGPVGRGWIFNDDGFVYGPNLGVFRHREWFRHGEWLLDRHGDGGPEERRVAFGLPTDKPVAGDWDGDGRDAPGVFREGLWFLDEEGDGFTGEEPIHYGLPGDIPVVGDWDNDGTDNLGVVRQMHDGLLHWFLDVNGDANHEIEVVYGLPGDIPVAGDWDQDGADDVGVVRAMPDGLLHWYLDTDRDPVHEIDIAFGLPGDLPVPGDWNRDGKDDPGVVRHNVERDGLDWYFDLNDDGMFAEMMVHFGLPGDTPVVGDWTTPDFHHDEPWEHIGHAYNVSALTTLNGKIFNATTDHRLWTRDPSLEDLPWHSIGHANNVVGMASVNGRLFAAERNGTLWVRDPVDSDVPWRHIGHAHDVAAMAAVDGKLYVATHDGKLWMRDPVEHDVPWQQIGHAYGVVGMTAAYGKLYAVTEDGLLWMRDPVAHDVVWDNVGQADGIVALAALGNKLYGAHVDGRLLARDITVPPTNNLQPFAVDRCDVNGDNIVTVIDALSIIDNINRYGSRQLNGENCPLDVDRNGQLTPSDLLTVVHRLNDGSRVYAESEGSDSESETLAPVPTSPPYVSEDDGLFADVESPAVARDAYFAAQSLDCQSHRPDHPTCADVGIGERLAHDDDCLRVASVHQPNTPGFNVDGGMVDLEELLPALTEDIANAWGIV